MSPGYPTSIVVENTLSNKREELRTLRPNRLRVYICGPTVYDSTHLGHARTYVTFDIIRRILEDHCGISLTYQCNITDIDDKIIVRAIERGLPIHEVCRRYEQEFLADMSSLNVRDFTLITRVSEYMAEIIDTIQRILDNGFAYESAGSIYFDVTAAHAAGKKYPRLRPRGNSSDELHSALRLLEDAEGTLLKNRVDEKRSPHDFALWKAWKETEPEDAKWDATFLLGPTRDVTTLSGRPGWHIECSAMSIKELGTTFDLHLGGYDLQFPHHDNELIQTEAATGCQQAVNYFLHSGHLRVAGDVMSKSKKNFKTVREILEIYTPNQIRMLFTMVPYSSSLDYSLAMMDGALAREKIIVNFLANIDHEIGILSKKAPSSLRLTEPERLLTDAISAFPALIDSHFRKNFDYVEAMNAVLDLVDRIKAYLHTCSNTEVEPKRHILAQARVFVLRVLNTLGFTYGQGGYEGGDGKAVAEVVATFRGRVREVVQGLTPDTPIKDIKGMLLMLCDEVRDELLPPTGFILEDADDQTLVKHIDVLAWKAQKRREDELAASKRAQQERLCREREEKLRAERERAQIPAEDLFRNDPTYSNFDSRGIPTHLAELDPTTGNPVPVPKSRLKKLVKEWEQQKKLNEKHADVPI
ncbi:Cysteinyl-tRNA synthetase [Giardia muris]|uniref:cysteine--tRNA ligase n=1 Tax=Giardia muris TaxID=5742 RepID=A0A4Z1SZ94_GIAMU|nr:Cysteinyl-tRNA synthetase [Giardia muris]|eukprot:TNJ26983.1 Cysteinyl-tRNA synthetase [Giardia muris]